MHITKPPLPSSFYRLITPWPADMNTFLLLMLGLATFLALTLAWFAISSCLGDEIRALLSRRRRQYIPTTYSMQHYGRFGMPHGGGREGIEMENMISPGWDHEDDD